MNEGCDHVGSAGCGGIMYGITLFGVDDSSVRAGVPAIGGGGGIMGRGICVRGGRVACVEGFRSAHESGRRSSREAADRRRWRSV